MPPPSSTPSLAHGLLLFFELYASALVVLAVGLGLAVLGMRPKAHPTAEDPGG
jgi:hypothetical protein